MLTSTVFAGPVSVHGDLQLLDKGGEYGVTLCDQHGKPIQLRGFSQLDIAQPDTEWVPGKTIPNIVALSGSNAVRIAMYTSTGGKGYMDQNAAGKTAYRNKVKVLIADAIAADIYVLVDWHILNDKAPWSEEYRREARIFFEDIAQTYGDKDNLLFELANEPLQVSFKYTIKPFAEHVLAGIRKHSDNIATVGTPNWSQHVDTVVGNQLSENLGRGVMYNIHFYAGTHGRDLRERANKARAKGVPLIISEFGTVDASGDGRPDLKSSRVWINWARIHNYSWFNWSLSIRKETSAAIANGDLAGPWKKSDFSRSGKWILKRLSEK